MSRVGRLQQYISAVRNSHRWRRSTEIDHGITNLRRVRLFGVTLLIVLRCADSVVAGISYRVICRRKEETALRSASESNLSSSPIQCLLSDVESMFAG